MDGSVPPTTRSTTRRAQTSTRSGPTAYGIRSAPISTPLRVAFSSATSAATKAHPTRRSTSASAAPTSAGPTSRVPAIALHSPLYDYEHNDRDASITGGFVYHGAQFPTGMQGNYFFADYAQNWIGRLTFNPDGSVAACSTSKPANGQVDGPYGDIVCLTEGPGRGAVLPRPRVFRYHRHLRRQQGWPVSGTSVQPGASGRRLATPPAAVPLTVTFSRAGSNNQDRSHTVNSATAPRRPPTPPTPLTTAGREGDSFAR